MKHEWVKPVISKWQLSKQYWKSSKDENFSSLSSLRVLIEFKANLKPSFQNFGRRGNKDWYWSYQGTSHLETFQSSNYKLWLKGLRYGTLSGKIPRKIKLLEGDVGGIRMIWWKNLGIMEFKENVRPLWISMPHLPPPPHPPTHPSCKNIFWLPFRPLTALMTGYLNTKELTFCFIIMTDKNRFTPVSIFLPFTSLNQLHIL